MHMFEKARVQAMGIFFHELSDSFKRHLHYRWAQRPWKLDFSSLWPWKVFRVRVRSVYVFSLSNLQYPQLTLLDSFIAKEQKASLMLFSYLIHRPHQAIVWKKLPFLFDICSLRHSKSILSITIIVVSPHHYHHPSYPVHNSFHLQLLQGITSCLHHPWPSIALS